MDQTKEIQAILQHNILIDCLMGGNYSEGLIRNLLEWGYSIGNWTAASHTDNMCSSMFRIEEFRWIVGRLPEKAFIAESFKDIEKAKAEGKFGVLIGFQGAEPIGDEYRLLSIFWRLGLRILGLTYNGRNYLGDGCLEPENRGLTRFGIEIVRDCNQNGIVIDLSHAGIKTSLDAIELSSHPCVFSHSNPNTTHPNPRNVTNDQMKAVAQKGGVICLAAWSNFVGDTNNGRHPEIGEYIRQIEYAVDLLGIDHVGIGSDIYIGNAHAPGWDNTTKRRYPELVGGMAAERHNILGYEDYGSIKKVIGELLKRGYKTDDISKIIGGNLLRVFREVLK